jgi:hypothetical protein
MLQRIIVVAAVIAGAYWYWSGPYQEKINPSYETILEQNDEKMALCLRAAAYKRGSTGSGPDAEGASEQCAKEYNVYEKEGRWHSYDLTRPE